MTHSLGPRWAGPFRILGELTDNTYELEPSSHIYSRTGRHFDASALTRWYLRHGAPMLEPTLEPHDEMPNIFDLSQEDAFESHLFPVATTPAASPLCPNSEGRALLFAMEGSL